MDVFIEGVKITLTKTQQEIISKHKKKIERGFCSMASVLKVFGFKKITDSVDSFENKKYGWYAEIRTHNNNWHSVWMIGNNLKSSQGFPGGWVYDDMSELREELTRAVEVIFNTKTSTEP